MGKYRQILGFLEKHKRDKDARHGDADDDVKARRARVVGIQQRASHAAKHPRRFRELGCASKLVPIRTAKVEAGENASSSLS